MNKMDNIKISVIIPVYNVQKYISECLDSVLKECDDDVEIICIDDNSDDDSLAILRMYGEADGRIRIYASDRHIGVADARNIGIKHAKGEYILFLDSDDMLVEGTLQHLMGIVSKQDYDTVFFDYKSIYESESIKKKLADRYNNMKKEYEGEWKSGIELFCTLNNNSDLTLTVWSQMYRRQFLWDNEIQFESGILHEDVPFVVISMWLAKKIYYTNRECYIWRHRANSITTQDKTNMHIEGRVIGLKRILDFLYEHPITEAYYTAVEKFVEKQCLEIKYSFQEIATSMDVFKDDYKNKLMLEVFLTPERVVRIKEECICELQKWNQIIIYGAGKIASLFMNSIGTLNKCIEGVVVTDPSSSQEFFYGYKVGNIADMLKYKKEALVCVALSPKYFEDIKTMLEREGYEHIILVEYEIINKGDLLRKC